MLMVPAGSTAEHSTAEVPLMLDNSTSKQSPMRPGVPQNPALPGSLSLLNVTPLQPGGLITVRRAGERGEASIIVVC